MSDSVDITAVRCAPCRGTASVTSRLGGEEHAVPCPWCEGTGTFIPDHDSRAAREEIDRDATESTGR